MAREIELKLALSESAARTAARHPILAGAQALPCGPGEDPTLPTDGFGAPRLEAMAPISVQRIFGATRTTGPRRGVVTARFASRSTDQLSDSRTVTRSVSARVTLTPAG